MVDRTLQPFVSDFTLYSAGCASSLTSTLRKGAPKPRSEHLLIRARLKEKSKTKIGDALGRYYIDAIIQAEVEQTNTGGN